MSNPKIPIPEEIAPEVLELASRYYAEQEKSYADSELVEAATEAGIPARFIEQAIKDVRMQHQHKIEQQRQASASRQRLLKIGAAFLAAIALWSVWTYNSFSGATLKEEKAVAIVEVDRAIGRFRDYAAANPQLQSAQLFVNLQYELAGTENRLAVERMRYNRTAQDYNQKIQGFPNSLVAKALGFERQSFFQATTADVPQIPR